MKERKPKSRYSTKAKFILKLKPQEQKREKLQGSEVGRTVDIVAKKIGYSSGRQYERADSDKLSQSVILRGRQIVHTINYNQDSVCDEPSQTSNNAKAKDDCLLLV